MSIKVNKLLTTGLIIATTMSAQSSTYGKGGFYCEFGIGASMKTMKYKNDAPAQNDVEDVEKIVKKYGVDTKFEQNANNKIREETTNSGRVRGLMYSEQSLIKDFLSDVSEVDGIMKKNLLPHVDFTFGADFVKGRARLGVDVSFEHTFGKTSRTESGLNMNGEYVTNKKIKDFEVAVMIGKNFIKFEDTPLCGMTERYYDSTEGYAEYLVDLYAPEFYDSALETKITQKNRFNISLMPKIGIIVNPQLEFYGTVGIVIKSDRYKISFPNLRSKGDDKITKTVTKAVPRVGCGALINLGTSGTYVRIGYYSTFKSKGKKKTDALSMTNTFETSEQLIRIAIGKRF